MSSLQSRQRRALLEIAGIPPEVEDKLPWDSNTDTVMGYLAEASPEDIFCFALAFTRLKKSTIEAVTDPDTLLLEPPSCTPEGLEMYKAMFWMAYNVIKAGALSKEILGDVERAMAHIRSVEQEDT